MTQIDWIFKEATAPLLPARAMKIFLVTGTLYVSMLLGIYVSPVVATFIAYHLV